ncbi:hypothetical protein EYR40_010475 [Pleurotus pulmonarius]|nr:hypothetical protein EYR36_010141 [Pleurotus pulmonarius]KAF4588920.1 hypothetical protein EYR40_010475 [Pleurotus pulmonarius]
MGWFWREPDSRLYIDKIFMKSSRFANWEPACRIEPGDFGTLSKRTGEFLKEGSIFTLPSTAQYAAANLRIKDGAVDHVQEYVSIGAHSIDLEGGPEVEIPGIASATVKTQYQFTGRRGAVLVMHRPHPRSLEGGVRNIPSTELRGKNLVTSVVDCPDYYMFLSQKKAGRVSLVLHANAPTTAGVAAGGGVGAGWKRYGLGGTYKASEPGQEYTPLYQTVVWDEFDRLRSAPIPDDDDADEGWVPAVPPWEVTDSSDEEEETADNAHDDDPDNKD